MFAIFRNRTLLMCHNPHKQFSGVRWRSLDFYVDHSNTKIVYVPQLFSDETDLKGYMAAIMQMTFVYNLTYRQLTDDEMEHITFLRLRQCSV